MDVIMRQPASRFQRRGTGPLQSIVCQDVSRKIRKLGLGFKFSVWLFELR